MVVSYTGITTFEKCPQQFFLRYEKKIPVAPTPALRLGDIVHKAIVLYLQHEEGDAEALLYSIKDFNTAQELYKKGVDYAKSFIRRFGRGESAKVYAELKIAITKNKRIVAFDSPKAFLRGKIDLIVVSEDGIALADFKTGWGIIDERQLLLYAGMLHYSPDFKKIPIVNLTFFDLRHDEPKEVLFNEKDLKRILDWAIMMADKIKEAKKNKDFPPTPGTHCSYCLYQLYCPLAKEITAELPTDPKEMARLYLFAQNFALSLKKQLEKHIKETGEAVILHDDGTGFYPSKGHIIRVKDKAMVLNAVLKSGEPLKYIKFDNQKVYEKLEEARPFMQKKEVFKMEYKKNNKNFQKEG